MKKLFLLLFLATLFLGVVAQQNPMPMPQKAYVAGQNGNVVSIYDCNERAEYFIPGYLQDIGVDSNGDLYTLVCNNPSGWGNYYVYKNVFGRQQFFFKLDEDKALLCHNFSRRVRRGSMV